MVNLMMIYLVKGRLLTGDSAKRQCVAMPPRRNAPEGLMTLRHIQHHTAKAFGIRRRIGRKTAFPVPFRSLERFTPKRTHSDGARRGEPSGVSLGVDPL
jgi:hypothetical protein